MAAGQVRTGFSRSSTVTVWVQEARLPAASVAVQVIAVVPTGYRSVRLCPSARAPWTGRVTPLQPAWAVAMAQTWAPQRPAALGTTIAGEQVITTGGETLSRLPGQSPAVWVAIGVPSWRVPVRKPVEDNCRPPPLRLTALPPDATSVPRIEPPVMLAVLVRASSAQFAEILPPEMVALLPVTIKPRLPPEIVPPDTVTVLLLAD